MFLQEENVSFSSAQGCDAVVQTVSGFEASTILGEDQAGRLVRENVSCAWAQIVPRGEGKRRLLC